MEERKEGRKEGREREKSITRTGNRNLKTKKRRNLREAHRPIVTVSITPLPPPPLILLEWRGEKREREREKAPFLLRV